MHFWYGHTVQRICRRRIVVILFSDSEPWGKKTGSKQKEVAAAVSGKQGPVIATTRTTRRALKATAPPGSSPPEDPVDTAATPKATIKPAVVQFAASPVANCGLLARCNRAVSYELGLK